MRISTGLLAALMAGCWLAAYLLHAGVTVTTQAVDADGNLMLDAKGEEVFVVSKWLTWKLNWLPNVLEITAGCLLAGLVWRMISGMMGSSPVKTVAAERQAKEWLATRDDGE